LNTTQSITLTIQALKRELLEQKLQAKLKKEKEELQLKLDQDLLDKKAKLLQQRKEEDLKRLQRLQATLETHYLTHYPQFLQTETQPPVFFAPAIHSPKSLDRLQLTRQKYNALFKEHEIENIPQALEDLYPSSSSSLAHPDQQDHQDHQDSMETETSVSKSMDHKDEEGDSLSPLPSSTDLPVPPSENQETQETQETTDSMKE
jgi:hypothetical protein